MKPVKTTILLMSFLALIGCAKKQSSGDQENTENREASTQGATEISRIGISAPDSPDTPAIINRNPNATSSATTAPLGARADGAKPAISDGEIVLYQQQIASTLNDVMKSQAADPKAKGAANAMAEDLAAELEIAKRATTPQEVEASRKRIEEGIQRLASVATQPLEPK